MAKLAISADSHIVEPRDVFAGLPERFGDRAPRIVRDEGVGDFVEIPAIGAAPQRDHRRRREAGHRRHEPGRPGDPPHHRPGL